MGGGEGGMPSSDISIFGLLFLFQIARAPISLEVEEIDTHSSSASIFPGMFIKQTHDKVDDIIITMSRPIKFENDPCQTLFEQNLSPATW